MTIQKAIEHLRMLKNARKPSTFNEKIAHKAAFDRRPILTLFADKIKVRDYVAEKIGHQYLSQIYRLSYDVESLDWKTLPTYFVAKVNHGSGGVILLWDGFENPDTFPEDISHLSWTSLKLQPSSIDFSKLTKLFQHWLTLDYYWYEGCGRMPEWAYKNVKPGVIVEELLLDKTNKLPIDYKLHIFNGKCLYINVVQRHNFDFVNQKTITNSNIFNPQWQEIDLVLNNNQPASQAPLKPKNLEEMIEVAEKLSNQIDYVRVDLYNFDGRIVFGEMTNYPSAAKNIFNPASYDLRWGQEMALDK